ncbi:MAG TPA: hypothetical protein VMQ67_07535 [Candidatus Saccharimonadales bacterium]|nr:hypothetical protein [Candidatus Saccharimonadales bacterium]
MNSKNRPCDLRASQERFDFADARHWVPGKIVFPDSQDKPALLTQRFRHQTISTLVCREFLFPKHPIVERHIGMFGASMPETAVHKNCNALLTKNEVWLPKS